MYTKIKTEGEIASMRASGRMLAAVLKMLEDKTGPGMTSKEAAVMASKELKAMGGKPAFYDYNGFPDVLCVSINYEIVHGIPSAQRELHDGDLVSYDFGVDYQGMITDSAFTMIVGKNESKDVARLLKGTRQSLFDGVDAARDGARVGDVAEAIEITLKKYELGIVRELVGHGVGHHIHEEPNIPNYGTAGTGPVLKAGMTIAIEPMTTLGQEDIGMYPDGWTVVTADQSLSAHFEHTVLITDSGAEILTVLE
ncbi:MAG TPA: type I methionyl aminopeptidase [Candidatus Saccharimonadales bacterium]|jgi:methionyl aminopeptidase